MTSIESQIPRVRLDDRIPGDLYFGVLNEGEEVPRKVQASEVFDGKKVVLFGIPGAFTSVCSAKHLPQYIEHYEDFKTRGIDTVACTAVNDPYVLREWAHTLKNQNKILMLADGDSVFHRALGLMQKIQYAGERGLRFSLYADDGVVKVLNIEEPGPLNYKISGPEHMLQDLKTKGVAT